MHGSMNIKYLQTVMFDCVRV